MSQEQLNVLTPREDDPITPYLRFPNGTALSAELMATLNNLVEIGVMSLEERANTVAGLLREKGRQAGEYRA